MKVGIIGSGIVATTLGTGFLNHGHEVMLGTREASKLEDFAKNNPKTRIGSFAEVAQFGDLVVLAVKGTAAVEALELAGTANLAGKPVIDTTNPIADAPPENAILKYFTSADKSLMEILQEKAPHAHFVKAFNSVGAPAMVNPNFKGGKPTMFIAGNNEAAKKTVSAILDQFGWEIEDVGVAAGARAIEPLCILWCAPGFLRNDWNHAFKMLR